MADLPNFSDSEADQPGLWDLSDADVWAYATTKDETPSANPYTGVSTDLIQDSEFDD